MDIRLLQPFADTAKNIFMEMADIAINPESLFIEEQNDMTSYGVTSIINFIGKIKGRLVIDIEQVVALKLANRILSENYSEIQNSMVLYCISEINNIIAGNTNTYLNDTYFLNMRLAPPIVYTGKDVILSIPKISSWSIYYNTKYGKVKVNVAFEGGIE